MREIFRNLTVLMIVVTLLGCNSAPYGPTGKITGKLTMDGKLLPAGHAVTFMQMNSGFLAFGITDSDGKFVVGSWNNGDMPIGKYDVMIAPPTGGDVSNLSAEERFDKPELSAPKARVQYPARYRETTTSGLQFTVIKGDNHFDIDLKPK